MITDTTSNASPVSPSSHRDRRPSRACSGWVVWSVAGPGRAVAMTTPVVKAFPDASTLPLHVLQPNGATTRNPLRVSPTPSHHAYQ
jgi:hypothetical protein